MKSELTEEEKKIMTVVRDEWINHALTRNGDIDEKAFEASTEGHFVKDARKVVALDEVNETYLVEGKSELVTKNHTTLQMEEDCLITCQTVYNPFAGVFEKSRD